MKLLNGWITPKLWGFYRREITWSNHIDHVSKKISKGIGVLRRAKNVISKESLERLYKALVLPHFDYCYLVWDNCSSDFKRTSAKVTKQNRSSDHW